MDLPKQATVYHGGKTARGIPNNTIDIDANSCFVIHSNAFAFCFGLPTAHAVLKLGSGGGEGEKEKEANKNKNEKEDLLCYVAEFCTSGPDGAAEDIPFL